MVNLIIYEITCVDLSKNEIFVLLGQSKLVLVIHFDATFGKNVANRLQAIEMTKGHGYNHIQEDGDGNDSSFHRRFYAFSDNKKMRKQWRV